MPNPQHIAYITSRFPKISETFILYEMVELEKRGFEIDVFPLIQQNEAVMHPEAQAFVDRAYFNKPLSPKVLRAQLYWLFKRPIKYLQTWATAIKENLRSPEYLLRVFSAVPQGAWFAKEMAHINVDHIHAHWATHATLAAYVASNLAQIPYSFTAHANDIFVDQAMLRAKVQNAAFVVTISDFNVRFLREKVGGIVDDKVNVVHCGVDIDLFTPRPPRPSDAPFTITCVGRLDHKKGQTYLVEACAQLRDLGLPIFCQLVGDGPDKEVLQNKIESLGLSDTVKLCGSQPRHKVKELLASSDVMVLPSVDTPSGRKEGIPVALMEAMAMELPVIGTILSGIPELIDHEKNGYLVPEKDVSAIVSALQDLIANPDKGIRLGQAGRQKVLAEFDLKRNVANLQALFEHYHHKDADSIQSSDQALRETIVT